MADYSATTLLTVGREALRAGLGARLLKAVQQAVAGDYEVLGEMGRGAKGRIVYLARETSTRHLVALQLTPSEDSTERGEVWLDVLRKLDAAVPSGDDKCPRCTAAIRGWGRFCSQCGADLSGIAPGSGDNTSVDQLLAAVKEAAGHRYEVLGQMDRAEGGGVVYFARERGTGNIAALRLQRRPGDYAGGRGHYDLGRTMVLKAVVESMVGSDAPAPPMADAARLEPQLAAPAPTPDAQPKPAARPTASRQRRTLALAGGALLVLLAIGFWLSRERQPAAAGDSSAIGVIRDTVAPEAAVVDSAEVEVGGRLPPRVRLTVDGERIEGRRIRLAPGTHEFVAAAPGYVSTTQSLELRPGHLMTWTPQMVRASAARSRPAPVAPSPAQRANRPREPAPDTSSAPLVIHQPPSAPATPDTQAAGALVTSDATCGSLFASLEWSRALTVCEREATAGGTAAQRTLATMHERGLATEANPTLAAEWYGKASAGGDRVAQYRLGVLLRSGRGVRKDEKAAVQWFRKSADQGEANAQLALAEAYDRGQGFKRSRTTAATWYLKAAEQGSAAAQFRLGEFHAKGEAGLPKSEPDAVRWFRLAAAQGHKKAQEELAKRGAPR